MLAEGLDVNRDSIADQTFNLGACLRNYAEAG